MLASRSRALLLSVCACLIARHTAEREAELPLLTDSPSDLASDNSRVEAVLKNIEERADHFKDDLTRLDNLQVKALKDHDRFKEKATELTNMAQQLRTKTLKDIHNVVLDDMTAKQKAIQNDMKRGRFVSEHSQDNPDLARLKKTHQPGLFGLYQNGPQEEAGSGGHGSGSNSSEDTAAELKQLVQKEVELEHREKDVEKQEALELLKREDSIKEERETKLQQAEDIEKKEQQNHEKQAEEIER